MPPPPPPLSPSLSAVQRAASLSLPRPLPLLPHPPHRLAIPMTRWLAAFLIIFFNLHYIFYIQKNV